MTANGISKPRRYLDWNATAPLHPAARAAMIAALDVAGNPSSIHAEGRAARRIIEEARADVAALVGGEAENVVFTSGASEAANALLGVGLSGCCGKDIAGDMRVVVSGVEHAAVLAAAGADALIVPVKPDGLLDMSFLAQALANSKPALLAVQLANNETGVIQPIAEIGAMVHTHSGALVVDAVQGPGKMSVDLATLDADALFLSGHKLGAAAGIGAIIFRNSRTRLAHAFIRGGGQERGQRGGTENVAGVASMGAAARMMLADKDAPQRMHEVRAEFENRLMRLAPDVQIMGVDAPRLANTTCFAIPGLTAEMALIAFDLDGIAVSSGSACSSGKVKPSHVLDAMGQPDWVKAGAIRVSIGPVTGMDAIEHCLASMARQLARRTAVTNAA